MRSKTERRHHARRMEAKARNVARRWGHPDDSAARRMRDNLKPCSCWMCGNPRRYFGERTIQERRRLADDE